MDTRAVQTARSSLVRVDRSMPRRGRANAGRPIIQVKDLTIGWGDVVLQQGLTFDVARGEVFAILGGVASSDVYQLSIEVPAAAAASPSPGATLPTPGPESSVPSPTPSPAALLPEGRYASSAETRPSTIPAPERRGAGP